MAMEDQDFCPCDPGTGEVYDCDDPDCPRHGDRNKLYGWIGRQLREPDDDSPYGEPPFEDLPFFEDHDENEHQDRIAFESEKLNRPRPSDY